MISGEYDRVGFGTDVSYLGLKARNWRRKLIGRSRRGVFQGYANILYGAGAG